MAVYLALLSEQLLEVLTLILSNTMINSLFYCVSCGWCVTIFCVNRNMISNAVIIGGSLYLLMLAQDYSTTESTVFTIFFTCCLLAEYMIL